MWRPSERAQACVQELHGLLSSVSWSRPWQRENDIVALLERINDREEPAAVCAVARCLFEPSQRIKTAASQTIRHLLSLVSPDQLTHLDDAVGGSCGWYISDDWDKLAPESVSALLVDAGSRAAVLGLLSFHRNGYVRHEAVCLLAREETGEELPYLLVRQNDWVRVIGAEAQTAVEQRLVPPYLPHFVKCLPLVVHTLAFRRHDLSPVVNKVVEMLMELRHDAMLAEVIQTSNRYVRRQVVRLALEMPGEHHARVMVHGLSSMDAVVRLACARQVSKSCSGTELKQQAIMLQRDPFMPVRREGFLAEATDNPDGAASIWRRALLDPHASIRELARYSLAKIGGFDAAGFYRRAYAENSASLSVIAGLAESGDKADVAILRKFLVDPRVRFRVIAIHGVARLDGEQAVDNLVRSLRDSSPKVVREARRELEPFLNVVPSDVLFSLANEAHSEQTKNHALQLIFSMGKWQSLPWLMRLSFHANDAIALSARRLIEAWFSPPLCNRVFTKPAADERNAINAALEDLRGSPPDTFLAKIKGWIESV